METEPPAKPVKHSSPPPPAGVDAEKVAKKYFLSPPPPPPPAPPSQFNKTVSFIDALKTCKDMECVKSAHYQPKKEAKFNFPHFLIIGFQKAATTSLHVYVIDLAINKSRYVLEPCTYILNVSLSSCSHLGKHPQALRPLNKEPEFFTNDCNNDPPKGCPEEASIKYINETLKLADFIESKGRIAPYESSTHVVRRGDIMAKKMHDLVPWAKIIISLREPISRAASMLIHMKDVYNEGCLSEENLGYCLHARSQIRGLKDGSTSYFEALSHWFTHWPETQIHIVQYEELTNERTEHKVMRGIKNFIEIDPELPQGGLTVINDRRFRIQPKGWPMSKKQYLKLIDLVKPDVEKTLDLLEAHGKLRYREGWMKKWEKVWEDNLNTCDKDGNCIINLS